MKRTFRKLHHGSKREQGQALVEFGLVILVFMTFICGIFDTARLLESWVTVQHAAREGARYGITGQITCTSGGVDRNSCIVSTAKKATLGVKGGGAGGADVTVSCKSWDFNGVSDWTEPGTSVTANCTGTSSGTQCDAIEVSVTYQHQFFTPFLTAILPSGVPIVGEQRMINEPFGPCT